MSATIEDVHREVRDLRGLVVSLERTLRKAERRPDGRRFICAAAAAICHGRKDMDAVERWHRRAATSPATTTVPGWAQELAQSVVADYLLSLAAPAVAAPSLFAAAHGHAMAANVNAVIAGEASASFVGESQAIGVTSAVFSSVAFQSHAIKSICSFTDDLTERSPFEVEALLRNILNRAVSKCLDSVLFDANPASAARPAGLLNGVAATPGGATFAADVAALMAAISPVVPVFITSPGKRASLAAGGDLLGFGDYDVLASDAVEDTRLILVDADKLSVAFGGLASFSTSKEAVLVEQDQSTVTPAVDPGGVVGTPMRSLWQSNSSALKAVLPTSWVIAASGVAYTEATPP